MGNIGTSEILIVLVAALIILGPKRLPDAARQFGKAMAEFRRVSSGLQAEMRDAFVEPAVTAEPRKAPSVIEPVVAPPASTDPSPETPAFEAPTTAEPSPSAAVIEPVVVSDVEEDIDSEDPADPGTHTTV